MHELAVTQSILEIALRHADGARITQLHLVLGQLSSMIDDSVQFYWNIISKDTTAENAILYFRRVPAQMQCDTCSHIYALASDNFDCPQCGSTQARIIAGEEFYLESIEVEASPVEAKP